MTVARLIGPGSTIASDRQPSTALLDRVVGREVGLGPTAAPPLPTPA